MNQQFDWLASTTQTPKDVQVPKNNKGVFPSGVVNWIVLYVSYYTSCVLLGHSDALQLGVKWGRDQNSCESRSTSGTFPLRLFLSGSHLTSRLSCIFFLIWTLSFSLHSSFLYFSRWTINFTGSLAATSFRVGWPLCVPFGRNLLSHWLAAF